MECFKVYANEIEGRIDPAFYSIGLKHIKANITNLIKIKDIAEIQGGFAFKSIEYINKGVPLVRIQNITDGEIELTDTVFVEEKYKKDLVRFLLNENDILIAMTGATIGKIGRINKNNLPAFLNQRVGRFVFKTNNINKDYIYYILQLPIFQDQVKRLSLGGAQPNISPNSITNIQIPLPPLEIQNKIVQLMDNIYSLKKAKEFEAQKLLDSINDYVLDELGIKLPELKYQMVYIVNSDEVQNKRTDAYYYQPKFKEIEEAIKNRNYEIKKIGEIVEKDANKKIQIEAKKKYFYVEIGDIDKNNASINLNEEQFGEKLPKGPKKKLLKDDIIISTVRPYLKGIAKVKENKENLISTSAFYILRATKGINHDFLFGVVRSDLFMNLICRNMAGTTYPTVSEEDILNLKIPLPPLEIQNKIAEEVKSRIEKAKQLQREAKEELEKTKKEVEIMILGNEEI